LAARGRRPIKGEAGRSRAQAETYIESASGRKSSSNQLRRNALPACAAPA
jgi:hypothetical protein